MDYINVAIDGPAGAGKSTIAKMLAQKLDFVYIDTGAMYRAITYKALQLKIDLDDESQYQFLEDTKVILTSDNRVLIDGLDVTTKIRERDVTTYVSTVATLKIVRQKLVKLQRELANNCNVIMDGRDIGTHVLKKAQVKLYLTASVEERARRRYLELMQVKNNDQVDLEEIKKDIIRRDHIDSNRELNPLMQAEDALLIDTSNHTIDEVINKLSEIILGRVNIT